MPAKRKVDAPLSESSVSLKLSEIQKRCSELMEEPEGLTELSLVDSEKRPEDATDPYNLHR
ncbi:MAG: hypothetical protein ACE5KS_05045 [Woeseiaceae bacterium]